MFFRNTECDAVQPRADAAIQIQRVCPSSEDEEDRLEGVVGIGSISENPLAGSVHEGSVSSNETCERIFVAFGQKPREQIRIKVADMRTRPAIEDLH
jgi:hypothetical protein